MPLTPYTYDIATETANGLVNFEDLEQEIGMAGLGVPLERLDTDGGTFLPNGLKSGGSLIVVMQDPISEPSLAAVVLAHQGVAPVETFDVVESVFGRSGVVVAQAGDYDAADVGADPVGTGAAEAASAVSDHEGAGDPHPQYTDVAEAAAAAPVQSVNTQTGVVTLGAADVGADPAGSASTVQGNLNTHIADTGNPHATSLGNIGAGTYAELDAAISDASPVGVVAFGQSQSLSTTTSTTFQNKVSFTNAIAFPAGNYVFEISYGWNHDSQSDDFEARITFNGSQVGELHKQEPQDSQGVDATGTTQRHYVTRSYFFTLGSTLASGQTFGLDYRTDTSGNESSIWEAVCIIKRIG